MPTPESRSKKSTPATPSKSDDANETRERRGPVTLVSNCTRQAHIIVRRFDAAKQPIVDEHGKQATYTLVLGSTLDAQIRDKSVPKPTMVIQRNEWIALKRDRRAYQALRGRQKAAQLQIIGD
jgi:hypothetical protein